MQTITKVDVLLDTICLNTNEIKRWILGKYTNQTPLIFDLTNSIYIYNGPTICNNRFCFTDKGTRCYLCNSFSLLTDDGNLNSCKPLRIEKGRFAKQQIKIFRSPRSNIPFGRYEPTRFIPQTIFVSNINFNEKTFMVNKCDEASHIIGISAIISTLESQYNTSYIGSWVCDKVNIVRRLSGYGKIESMNFTEKIVKDTFMQIAIIIADESLIFPSVNSNMFSISPKKTCVVLGNNKNYSMENQILIEPNKHTMFHSFYGGKILSICGPETDFNTLFPKLIMDFRYDENNTIFERAFMRPTENPSMSEYVKRRILAIKITPEILNYYKKTGFFINEFLKFMLIFTVFMCNRSFHTLFLNSNLNILLRNLFRESEFNAYLFQCTLHFDIELSESNVENILINSNIYIRYDADYLLKIKIANFY